MFKERNSGREQYPYSSSELSDPKLEILQIRANIRIQACKQHFKISDCSEWTWEINWNAQPAR